MQNKQIEIYDDDNDPIWYWIALILLLAVVGLITVIVLAAKLFTYLIHL